MPSTVGEWIEDSHQRALKKGFWPEGSSPNISEKLMLIVSELAEAMEDHRSWDPSVPFNANRIVWVGGEKPEGFGIELADAAIRIFDLAGYLGLDLQHMLESKAAYNESRPLKHGRAY